MGNDQDIFRGKTESDVTKEASQPRVNDVEYVGREEALAVLGIKKESLYTYVSRGLIRTVRQSGKRTSLYRLSDIEKLGTRSSERAGQRSVASTLRYGEPLVQTQVSEITATGPRYRRQLASNLVAEGHSFEYAADLIWTGLPPVRDSPWNVQLPLEPISPNYIMDWKKADNMDPLDCLAEITLRFVRHTAKEEISDGDARTCGIPLIGVFSCASGLMGPRKAYQNADNNEYLAERLIKGLGLAEHPCADQIAMLINAGLVLSIDNELSPPTFTARITASTGANLYQCVLSAIMAQAGPMQVGGTYHLEWYLQSIINNHHRKSMAANVDIPCFDHPLYDKDPRAVILLEHLAAIPKARPTRSILLDFVDRTHRTTSRYPNLFGALVILAMSLHLPKGTAAFLHTLARTSGWLAHAVEQRLSGQMVRPRARYANNMVR